MKIRGLPGKFAFKALIQGTNKFLTNRGTMTIKSDFSWSLTSNYYFTKEDAIKDNNEQIIWPVEVYEDGSIYIPSEDELK